jgi:hypothetical protein
MNNDVERQDTLKYKYLLLVICPLILRKFSLLLERYKVYVTQYTRQYQITELIE